MSNKERDLFHLKYANYSKRNVLNRLKQTAKNEERFLKGLYKLPKPQPQGSFNRLDSFSGNSNQLNYNQILGNMRGGVLSDNTKVREQLKRRAEQLKTLNLGLPPSKREDIETPETVKTSFELFFSELSNVDFSLKEVTNNAKEAKQVLGNLKAYGLGLSINSLERYSQIVETHIDNYLGNMEKLFIGRDLFGKDIKQSRTGEPVVYKKVASTYLDYLERVNYYEVIFKIYLVLQSLINSYNMNPSDRKQKFDGDFNQIIKAKKNDLFNEDMKRINEEVKNGLDDLKDLLPVSAYKKIENYVKATTRRSTQGRTTGRITKETQHNIANLKDRGDVQNYLRKFKADLKKAIREEEQRAKEQQDKVKLFEQKQRIKRLREGLKFLEDNKDEEQKESLRIVDDMQRILQDIDGETQELTDTEAEQVGELEDVQRDRVEFEIVQLEQQLKDARERLLNHITRYGKKARGKGKKKEREGLQQQVRELKRAIDIRDAKLNPLEYLTDEEKEKKLKGLQKKLSKHMKEKGEDISIAERVQRRKLIDEITALQESLGYFDSISDDDTPPPQELIDEVQRMLRDGTGEESDDERPIIGQGRYLSPEQFTKKFIVGAGSGGLINWMQDVGDKMGKALGIFK